MGLMAGWRLRLKGSRLLEIGSGAKNPHQLAMRSGVSYPTAQIYVHEADNIVKMDVKILASMLIDGLGLTREQVLDLRLGDLFEIERIPEPE